MMQSDIETIEEKCSYIAGQYGEKQIPLMIEEKAVSIDPGTGKPYELQICNNDECMGKAWNIVTKALKRGVRPVFDTYPEKRTYVKLTDEQKDGIIRMYLEGCRRADIARETGTTYSNISYVIKKYREGNKQK